VYVFNSLKKNLLETSDYYKGSLCSGCMFSGVVWWCSWRSIASAADC